MAQTEHLPIYKSTYDLCLYLNRTTKDWHTPVGAILVIAHREAARNQGEYKIRLYHRRLAVS